MTEINNLVMHYTQHWCIFMVFSMKKDMKSDLRAVSISCEKTNMYKAMLWGGCRIQLREDEEKRACYVS